MSVEFRVEGLEALQKKLDSIGKGSWIGVGLLAAGVYLKGKLARYPRVSRRPMAQFWTPKQRRGFFALLNAGLIDVPYYRGINAKSERLGQSWTAQARNRGREVVVGNDASYGPLVQDRKRQAKYHQDTGWPTTQDVIEKHGKEAMHKVQLELRRILNL